MYNHNKAQQRKNRVHIFWDILYDKGTVDHYDHRLKISDMQRNIDLEYQITALVCKFLYKKGKWIYCIFMMFWYVKVYANELKSHGCI